KKKRQKIEKKEIHKRKDDENKKAILKQNPSPNTSKSSMELIETGNMTDDMEKLSEIDWIIEVVVEKLNIKKQVFADVEKHRKEGTIVSSNTSGISIEAMIEDCSEEMKAHFL